MTSENDTKLTEGDDAEREALAAERRAARTSAPKIETPERALAREMAERLRELGAVDVTAGGEPEPDGEAPDVLDGLAERANADPTVVFLPSVLEALLSLSEDEPYAFQQLWNQLKAETKVPMTPLRRQLDALARDAKRRAKKGEKERARAEALAEVERAREAREAKREAAQKAADEVWQRHFYTSDDGRLEMRPGEIITIGRREKEEPLAHYSARIATEVRYDTGARVVLQYEMEVIAGRSTRRFIIPAEKFGAMQWTTLAGAGVVTAAGPKARDLARECIQLASRPVPTRDEFGFIGWRTIDGRNMFLHAGGAIGGAGANVIVKLPDGAERLAFFELPAPLEGDDLKLGIVQCLEVMFSVPDFTGPLCAAAWRSVLGNNRNAIFVWGQERSGKTTAVLWAQNHFATKFTTAAPPSTWESTAFGIRAALAMIGDAPLFVDDYRAMQDPTQDRTFASVVRSVTDGTARSKGTVDSTVVQDPTPRALLFASGETAPKIDSLNSRIIALHLSGRLPLEKDTVDRFDRWAREGRFAGTMAAYIAWLAEGERLAKVRRRFTERALELATELQGITREGRSAKAIASLWAGVLPFFAWARSLGAITQDEQEQATLAISEVFRGLADEQIASQQSEDTSARFISYLASAIRSGQAHVTNGKRQAPEDPPRWGWQIADSTQEDRIITTQTGQTVEVQAKHVPRGRCIGILRGEYVYIDRKAALGLVQRMAAEMKESFTVDAAGLTEALLRRGFLAKVEGSADNPKSRTVRAYVAVTKASGVMVQKSGYICMRASLLCDDVADGSTPDDTDAHSEQS